ncbi:MAG: helix-turn-helix transcriptional regulator [Faecalimonas sp.]|nr:helix-turn-helix transcriptional regulator [Faecalimonas sp.]
MICAYDKVYLERARVVLARMLEYAVYDLKFDMQKFFGLFIESGVATRFERGDYTVLVGMSGVELAYEVFDKLHMEPAYVKPRYMAKRSEEYWTGWALAYYQWQSSLRFEEIIKYIPIHYVKALYSPYHEMDIRHFVDKMNALYLEAKPDTNLKVRRKEAGYSQKELAELSGVPVRTIQQYEQRQKNINKAQVEYLVRLSKTLCCEIEGLIEKV